jgi:PAS domain S-box-containing protein
MACEYLSREWLRFTGLSPEQALGDGWTRGVHPEDLARWLDTCVRAFDAREPFCIEYRLRRHDGDYRWVLDRGVPRYAPDGLFIGFAGTCVDIDDRKRCEQELGRALERERQLRISVQESSRLKDAFLATVLGSLQPPILAGTRVLVIDDDAEARQALLKVLAMAGAEVKSASMPEEALDELGAFRADVLLCGLGMAREGYALIRGLRSLAAERGRRVPAVALTSPSHPEDGMRAAAAGYDAQLAKPVEPVTLVATVARLAQPA